MYHNSTVCQNVHTILSPQPLKVKKISIDTLTKSAIKLSDVKNFHFSLFESDSNKSENNNVKDWFEEGSSYSNFSRDELVISRSENPIELDAKFIEFNNSLEGCLDYEFFLPNEETNN